MPQLYLFRVNEETQRQHYVLFTSREQILRIIQNLPQTELGSSSTISRRHPYASLCPFHQSRANLKDNPELTTDRTGVKFNNLKASPKFTPSSPMKVLVPIHWFPNHKGDAKWILLGHPTLHSVVSSLSTRQSGYEQPATAGRVYVGSSRRTAGCRVGFSVNIFDGIGSLSYIDNRHTPKQHRQAQPQGHIYPDVSLLDPISS